MASANCKYLIKKRYNIEVYPSNILGAGSYGIVYKAFDEEDGNSIVAKSIDGEKHPKIFKDNRQNLLGLKHHNIINILDLYQIDKTFWMMMEFCNHGDLNDFFRKKNPDIHTKVEIINGIAQGIAYLHRKDVIHRDIKPDNILMASEFPPIPKLTDFDLSKSLNTPSETMHSNVGSLAFKAPEFFTRVDGKLRYHKSVDIFAAGLTFLAMIQAEDGGRRLIPHIETPRDDSELHNPIGQLIAERIKYKIPELQIVTTETTNRSEEMTDQSLRQLIRQMTSANPDSRLSSDIVINLLAKLAPMQIFVNIIGSNKTIILNVNKTDSIKDVKGKIKAKEGIPDDLNRLWFSGKWLEEDRTLLDYNINAETTIFLAINLRGGNRIVIFIRTLTGKEIPLQVPSIETVENVKKFIQKIEELPVDTQRLIFANKNLEDDHTLSDYHIENGSIISLILRLRGGGVTLILKFFKTITIQFRESPITVRHVKQRIEELEEYPPTMQQLSVAGRVLPDDFIIENLELVLEIVTPGGK